jgi:hypothetical protein
LVFLPHRLQPSLTRPSPFPFRFPQSEAAAAGDDFADFGFVAVERIANNLPGHIAAALRAPAPNVEGPTADASKGAGAGAGAAAAAESTDAEGEEEAEDGDLEGFDHDGGAGAGALAPSSGDPDDGGGAGGGAGAEEGGVFSPQERAPLDPAAAEELQRHLEQMALGTGVGAGAGAGAGAGGTADG